MQQSRGWVHYAIHRPEPHIMLFRCDTPACIELCPRMYLNHDIFQLCSKAL